MNKFEEEENWKYVQNKMKNEEFDYCFRKYADFEEIEDEEFHRLRKKYIKIANKLENYINNKVEKFKDF